MSASAAALWNNKRTGLGETAADHQGLGQQDIRDGAAGLLHPGEFEVVPCRGLGAATSQSSRAAVSWPQPDGEPQQSRMPVSSPQAARAATGSRSPARAAAGVAVAAATPPDRRRGRTKNVPGRRTGVGEFAGVEGERRCQRIRCAGESVLTTGPGPPRAPCVPPRSRRASRTDWPSWGRPGRRSSVDRVPGSTAVSTSSASVPRPLPGQQNVPAADGHTASPGRPLGRAPRAAPRPGADRPARMASHAASISAPGASGGVGVQRQRRQPQPVAHVTRIAGGQLPHQIGAEPPPGQYAQIRPDAFGVDRMRRRHHVDAATPGDRRGPRRLGGLDGRLAGERAVRSAVPATRRQPVLHHRRGVRRQLLQPLVDQRRQVRRQRCGAAQLPDPRLARSTGDRRPRRPDAARTAGSTADREKLLSTAGFERTHRAPTRSASWSRRPPAGPRRCGPTGSPPTAR